jgi:hypothetical protein
MPSPRRRRLHPLTKAVLTAVAHAGWKTHEPAGPEGPDLIAMTFDGDASTYEVGERARHAGSARDVPTVAARRAPHLLAAELEAFQSRGWRASTLYHAARELGSASWVTAPSGRPSLFGERAPRGCILSYGRSRRPCHGS